MTSHWQYSREYRDWLETECINKLYLVTGANKEAYGFICFEKDVGSFFGDRTQTGGHLTEGSRLETWCWGALDCQ